jgi:plastocyanin domain-containing protein
MDAIEISVTVAGIAAILSVLWYFFGAREKVIATVSNAGVQEIAVTVKGGYSPDLIQVRKGLPVRLNFYRDETSSCSEQVVFGDFGIARNLPAFKTTSIEFTPDKTGEFTFTCGMNMLRGKLIVDAGRGSKTD